MLQAGGRLPALAVQGPSNQEIALASLPADAPLAAIFLRHFG